MVDAARIRRGSMGAVLAALLTLAACGGSDVASSAPSPTAQDDSVVARHAGERWFLGEVPSTPLAADPSREPVKLGLINQEQTAIGSYPEVRAAVEAAAAWVNAELGGVAGRPVEILSCVTRFDAEDSRACAERLAEEGVVAFVGGVDVMSDASIPVIEQHGLVTVGGIPAALVQERSPNAFFFSGGDAGALAAFMAHAAQSGRTRVALAYGQEVDSFAVAARDYGAAVGRSLGLEVELLPFSVLTSDYGPVLREARDAAADAVMVLAATSACVPVMQAAAREVPAAQLYLTGACAGEAAVAGAGSAAAPVIFNAEGRLGADELEAAMYQDVVDRYATEPAGGAGTVGFRGFMNLYALLVEAGPEHSDSVTVAALARAAVDRPSFWGHPFTCDGRQVPGLPALCAPQQVLFRPSLTGGRPTQVSDWIPTDELFAGADEAGPG